jgi:hypothetical protein
MFVANNGLDIAIENFHAPLPKGLFVALVLGFSTANQGGEYGKRHH